MPSALVIRAAGINCDVEVMRGLTEAGASARLAHLDALIRDPAPIERADIIVFPGGFSFGDDVASGRIFAMHVRERLWGPLRGAIERGACIAGICNGFQVIVQIGLLPGPGPGQAWGPEAPAPTLSLARNSGARYIDTWVGLDAAPGSPCVWTRGWGDLADDVRMLPCGHGEGRLTAEASTLDALEARGHVVLRYRQDVNGSARGIAGVCDASGRIFGLMPHPDRFLAWNRHPYWTRLDAQVRRGRAPGQMIFANAVEAATRMPV
ncbi:MAG: phosphoribosylformylglycinamidine synthase subunit PurQ [Phycisphaerales bacterium]|nr:phosphoribosylformylglycinamidine synthase subunit PurQ [Phycisphaerales bacterium]